ncbi:MAG: AmmeMemoRadiSam system radical SAM enzyme [Candidatus Omnitrophota bacterium]
MSQIIECQLCPHLCRLAPGQRGNCRVRIHLDGELQTLVYGNPCAVHVDPIEKKPLFHVLPSSAAFSIATAGCNLHCKYCQNWQISQRPPEETHNTDLPPAQLVRETQASRCRTIAYTYSDPVIFYEYALESSRLAHEAGLLNALVTAAYINQKPLINLCRFTDAANVDLKGITDEYYQRMSGGHLAPVKEAILTMQEKGVWVELTNLIVPRWNDTDQDIRNLCRWVKKYCGDRTPVHFSKFWPTHLLNNLPPTPTHRLSRAWHIARETGLKFPYVGNVPGHPGNHTYCPGCEKILIERIGYRILKNRLINGNCPACGETIPGIWS